MSGKNINFHDKKINKSIFCKNFNVDDTDVNKLLVSKTEPYGKKTHFNTLLGMVIMMKLDHYV